MIGATRFLVAAALALVVASHAGAAGFRPVEVYVDAGAAPLAAYQIEIVADGARVAGVEGGEHQAFSEPPHYDPAALQGGRIILASFDLGTDLPLGRTRVATLHMREDAAVPTYRATLIVAADAEGHSVPAVVEVVPQGDPR